MIGRAFMAALPTRLEAALAEAAGLVADRARELAPDRTGALRSSITAVDNTVIAAAPHAIAVELGSSKRAAQPYLRPALLELRERIAALVNSAMGGER